MSDDLFNVSDMIQILRDTLSNDLTVYDHNNPSPKRDVSKPIEPQINVSWVENNPNVQLDVYASSESKVCYLSKLVMTTLGCMERAGVKVFNVAPLTFEIEGALGHDWKPIKGSSPIHRIMFEIHVEGESS